MRLLYSYILFLFFCIIHFSCQKELNYTVENYSTGTLKTDVVSSECLKTTVVGTYRTNSPLNADHSIYVLVNVVTTGKYLILSDTINGYYFIGSGSFGNIGPNLVELNAKGTPEQKEINTFKISYGKSSCYIDVEVVDASSSTDAVYTLGGSGSTCTGFILGGGINQEGLTLGSQNTVTLNVFVKSPGNYKISTEPSNGVTYSASGSFIGGENTVTLIGKGTPLAAETSKFTVEGGGNTCTFSVTFDPPPGPAEFTLGGSPGECTNARQGGVFTVNVPTDFSNTVTISVNVTTVGKYEIFTDKQNGVSFSATGVFTDVGVQEVVLKADGTPLNNVTSQYTVSDPKMNKCTFEVSTDYIVCKIDGTETTFNIEASFGLEQIKGLSIDGRSNAFNLFPSIKLRVLKNNSNYPTGIYSTIPPADQTTVSCDYNDAAGDNYYATNDILPFTIIVTKITDKRIEGSFFGTLKDKGGIGNNKKEITDGLFSVPRS